ncbi:MAG: hypothetical protein SGBAC_013437 [Bacillariaceae sp.]
MVALSRKSKFQPSKPRRIPLPWFVSGLLLALFAFKEAAFSEFEASSFSIISSIIGSIGPKPESLKLYDWKRPELGAIKLHMEFVRTVSEIVPRNTYADIAQVHRNGLIHSGMVVAVLDTNTSMVDSNILLLRRSPEMHTCANAWGLVGEHTYRDETPEETVIRGMKEELGDTFYQQFVLKGEKAVPLVKLPVYVYKDYSGKGTLVDRQVTYLYAIEMNTPLEQLNNMMKVDDEVAEVKWMTRQEIEDGWMTSDPGGKFCDHDLAELLQLVLHRLEDIEREINAERYEKEMKAAAKRKAQNRANAKKAVAAEAEKAAAEAAAAAALKAEEESDEDEDSDSDSESDE